VLAIKGNSANFGEEVQFNINKRLWFSLTRANRARGGGSKNHIGKGRNITTIIAIARDK